MGTSCVASTRQLVITTEVQSDDKTIKQTVSDNYLKLKKDLCELETTATGHTSAIPELRDEVRGAITQVTDFIAKASSGQTAGVSLNDSMVALEGPFQPLQEHTDVSLEGLETIVREAPVDNFNERYAELAANMADVAGKGERAKNIIC